MGPLVGPRVVDRKGQGRQRYIPTKKNPQPSCALHILNNQHEESVAKKILSLE